MVRDPRYDILFEPVDAPKRDVPFLRDEAVIA